MKKILALLIASAMAVSLVACGSSSNSSSGNSTPSTTDSNTSTEKETIKVAYIGALGDNSFNDSAWSGLEKARDELGIEIVSIEPATAADYGSSVVSAINGGANMVMIFGGAYADTFNEYCERFPEVYFAGLNSVSANTFDNLVMASTGDHEGSFLAGALAAMVSKTGTVGAIGGIESDSINRFLIGYEEGAKYVNPDAKVLKAYVNGFTNPATAKEFAFQLKNEGADVIYSVAGGSNMGVFEAAKETDGLYAIGVDANQDSIVPGKILTSMVKRADNVAFDFAKMLVDGNFQSGVVNYGITNGGVSLTDFEFSKEVVTDEIVAALKEIEGKITSGEIKVTDNFIK